MLSSILNSEVGAVGGLVKRINGDLEFAYGVMSILVIIEQFAVIRRV